MTGNFSTQNKKKSMSPMWSSCNQSALTMILNVKMLSKNSLLKMKVRSKYKFNIQKFESVYSVSEIKRHLELAKQQEFQLAEENCQRKNSF